VLTPTSLLRDASFYYVANARLAYDPFRSVCEAILIKSKRFRDRNRDTLDSRTREISRLIIIAARERMEYGSAIVFRICIGTQFGVNYWAMLSQ
jgi:hypothetical protein